MFFDDWWNENCGRYSKFHKENMRDAFEAGAENCHLHAQREIENRDAIINFLKKELIKKSYCRKVMKQQYRELKQKYEALEEKLRFLQYAGD